ncbi:MAG: hypothetical protein MI919_20315 [Holophagales bacterium]|nr:hypothetical protein [Holophagales bacterium]
MNRRASIFRHRRAERLSPSRFSFSYIAPGLFVALVSILGMGWGVSEAEADVLVMKDGSRVEIDGPWEVRGRLIRFQLPNGTLGSVRASEVDLEASEAATEEANRPKPDPVQEPPPEPERREPVLVLTDKDIPSASFAPTGTVSSRDTTGDPVRVVSWNITPGAEDPVLELTGTIQNYGGSTVEGVQAFVDLIGSGPDGRPDASIHILRELLVVEPILDPGEVTDFRLGITQRDLDSSGNPDAFNDPVANFDIRFSVVEDVIGQPAEADEDSDAVP